MAIISSFPGGSSPDIATTSKAGIVKPDGSTVAVANDGTISITDNMVVTDNTGEISPVSNPPVYKSDVATTSDTGIVKADGTTITVDANGTIHAHRVTVSNHGIVL